MVEAARVVVEHVQLDPVIEFAASASAATCAKKALVVGNIAAAPATYEERAPGVENIAAAPTVTYAEHAPVVEHIATVSTAPAVSYAEQAPVVEHIAAAPAVSCAEHTPDVEHIAAASVVSYAEQTPDVEYLAAAPAVSYAEQVPGQGIPELQVVKQKQIQTVEAIKVNPLERVQRRAVEQSMSLFERLEEFDKRLEMSLARRSENEELIKEIVRLLEEKRAIDSADGIAKKVRWA